MKPTTTQSPPTLPKRTPPPLSRAARRSTGRHSRVWRRVALWLVAALAIGAIATYLAYSRDMHSTRDRLAAGSQVVTTRHSPIEYTEWGQGPAVLVIHGAGGGYDQGVSIARAFGGEGFRWISPSRFGYLRTPLPADASTAAQADAFADLLDALNIKRVAILAFSGGIAESGAVQSGADVRYHTGIACSSAAGGAAIHCQHGRCVPAGHGAN